MICFCHKSCRVSDIKKSDAFNNYISLVGSRGLVVALKLVAVLLEELDALLRHGSGEIEIEVA